VLDATTGIPSMVNDVKTIFSGNTSTLDKVFAAGDLIMNVAMDASMVVGVGEGLRAAYVGVKVVEEVGEHVAEDVGEHIAEDVGEHAGEDAGEHAAEEGASCGLSFSADTLVATPAGEQAISALHVGDPVLAYDPQTHQVSTQTVLHVWINHDTDRLDVTVQTQDGTKGQSASAKSGTTAGQTPASGTPSKPGQASPGTGLEETVHTTAKHPWLTADQGWVIAGQLKVGEPVVQADGKRAVVVALRVIPGAGTMYDLEVSHIHTFEVGLGRWVVHNCTLKDGTQVDVEQGLKQTFDKHAKQWFGRNVTDADRPADSVLSSGVHVFASPQARFSG
jgi:hypothetical protein